MRKVLIELKESQLEIVNRIKALNCELEEMTINHFDADPTTLSFLIGVTPIVVTQLGEIIKLIIGSKSKGKVKIEGIEIEGFSYEETMEILNIIAEKNEEERVGIVDVPQNNVKE